MNLHLTVLPGEVAAVEECLVEWRADGDDNQVDWLVAVLAGEPEAVRSWFDAALLPTTGRGGAEWVAEVKAAPGRWALYPAAGSSEAFLRTYGLETATRTFDGRRRTFARLAEVG